MGGRVRKNAGKFEVLNDLGQLVASSDHKLFRVTNVVIGQTALSTRNTPLDVVNTYDLGSVHASADFVLGYARMSWPDPNTFYGAPVAGQWWNVGGSYLHAMSGGGFGNAMMAVYSFYASGAHVWLEEQLAVPEYKNSVGQAFPYAALTLDYELWVGSFV